MRYSIRWLLIGLLMISLLAMIGCGKTMSIKEFLIENEGHSFIIDNAFTISFDGLESCYFVCRGDIILSVNKDNKVINNLYLGGTWLFGGWKDVIEGYKIRLRGSWCNNLNWLEFKKCPINRSE